MPSLHFTSDQWVFLRSFFVCVASIIGLGILSLPVRMYSCGFLPFVIVFTACGLAQGIKVVLTTELLQRFQIVLLHQTQSQQVQETDQSMESINAEGNITLPVSEVTAPERKIPDLHTMGVMLLHPAALGLYFLCVFLNYATLIIAYAIGASEVYAALMGLDYEKLIPFYVIVLGLLVCLLGRKIEPFVVFMTFAKGTILVLVILMTSVVGFKLFRASSMSWATMGDPFIISTLALAGTTSLQPVLYHSLDGTPRQVRIFRNGCLTALVVCWFLNVLWTFVVLKIVPQYIEEGLPPLATLEGAYKEHQIGTITLLYFLKERYSSSLGWLGISVNVFISISVTVSFIVFCHGWNHVLDGMAKDSLQRLSTVPCIRTSLASWVTHPRAPLTAQGIVYFGCYLFVLLVSTGDSKEFYTFLETYSGTAANIWTGIYVPVMHLLTIRFVPSDPNTFVGLPRQWSSSLGYVSVGFYGFAVLYGLYRETVAK